MLRRAGVGKQWGATRYTAVDKRTAGPEGLGLGCEIVAQRGVGGALLKCVGADTTFGPRTSRRTDDHPCWSNPCRGCEMNIQDFVNRIDELLALAENTLATERQAPRPGVGSSVDGELFAQLRTSSLSLIRNLFGHDHPYYGDFDSKVIRNATSMVRQAKGILLAVKQEVEGGWFVTVKGLLSAEVFADFMEMSEYLLTEGYKDAAAVITGSVLEEHLRQLCSSHGIQVTVDKEGRKVPRKADALNADLAKAGAYKKLDQKMVTGWQDLRNNAAHGHYEEYSHDQVVLMHQGVTQFISRVRP